MELTGTRSVSGSNDGLDKLRRERWHTITQKQMNGFNLSEKAIKWLVAIADWCMILISVWSIAISNFEFVATIGLLPESGSAKGGTRVRTEYGER